MNRWMSSLVVTAVMIAPIIATATPLASTASAAESCYAIALRPNGALATCSDGGRRWLKAKVECHRWDGVIYYRLGPRVYGGTGQESRIYCDRTEDSRISYSWVPA